MEKRELFDKAKNAIVEADESKAFGIIAEAKEMNIDLLDLLLSGFGAGNEEIGDRFDKGIFSLPELIYAAEVMKNVTNEILSLLDDKDVKLAAIKKGTVLLATVAGDIHDIGKGIVASSLRNAGFDVIDLGCEVPIAKIIEAAEEYDVDIIGTSALLTSTLPQQKKLEKALRETGKKQEFATMVGGAPCTPRWAKRIGADGYSEDAIEATKVALELMGHKKKEKKRMGKELIFKVLNHEPVDEIPWVPFTGVHAGLLKGYTAEEMLQDADKIVECLEEVNRLYMPDGLPVVFDLQLEAEILGCELMWAKDNPPSVKTHPLADEATIPCNCKIPTEESGRIPAILDATRRIKASIGDEVAIYGLICGPFTLASHLRGTNIFMDMMKNPDYVKQLVGYCGQVAVKMADMYIEAGCDVIAVVDPLISQVSPKMINKLLAESFTSVFDYVRSRDVLSSFFVCGNASNQIEEMCKCGPDCVAVDENVNLPKAKETTDKYNVVIEGNIPLTTTMLHGTQEDNIKCVIDLIDSLGDKKDYIISPGCDMPYATPKENTIACSQAVKNPESSKKLVENYESSFDDVEVDIPDYANADKVIIELFLLDPEQCAACTYMLAAVEDLYEEIKDIAEYRVYKYFIKEDIARTRKMGIANLPTMCINGEQKFISLIPSKEELLAAIKAAAK